MSGDDADAGLLGRLHVDVLSGGDPAYAGRRSAGVAPESYPNHGLLFALAGCSGPDLTPADFAGTCIYFNMGASLYYGYGAEAMLIDCNPRALAFLDGSPFGEIGFMINLRPHALLLSWGPSKGLQANAGISASVGLMRHA